MPSWRFTLGDETRKNEVEKGNYETREDVERLKDET